MGDSNTRMCLGGRVMGGMRLAVMHVGGGRMGGDRRTGGRAGRAGRAVEN